VHWVLSAFECSRFTVHWVLSALQTAHWAFKCQVQQSIVCGPVSRSCRGLYRKDPKPNISERMKNRESKSVWSRGYMFLGPILRKVGGVHPISHVGPKKLSWTFANLVQSSCQSYRQPDSGNLSTWYQRPDWGFKVRFAPSRIYKVNVLMSRNYHICVTNSLHLYQFQENVTIFRKSLKLNFSRNLAASPLS